MAKVKQYVNLPQISLFVERGITSLDRLGPVHFRTKFKTDDPMLAKFRTVPVSEVSPYTETEKRRNRWYKLQEPVGMQVSEGTEMVSGTTAQLPPSGGAVYKIEARAGDKTVESTDEIETWRRLFFQTFYMKHGSDPKKDVPDLKDTLDYYEKKLFVELLEVPKGVRTEIPYLENATSEDLIRLVKPKYTVKDREPWVLALVFSNALPGFVEIKIGVDIPGNVELSGRLWGNEEIVFELPKNKYAWWGLKPDDDAENGGKGIWLRGDGTLTANGKNFVIPKDSIRLDTSHSFKAGKGFNRLKITLPKDARNQNVLLSKDAKLTLKLWVMDGFSGGFALRDENLLTVARTAWWRDTEKTEPEKLQTLNHELGHKLGMVPKGGRHFGGRYELDAPDKLYGDVDLIYGPENPSQSVKDYVKRHDNSKGHRGAHCERGASGEKADGVWEWSGKPECTMFGANAIKGVSALQKFCEVCAKLVIRQNLDPAHPDAVLSFKSLLDIK
jgi:hypothetical protein